jgi:hypothetical protein
MPNKIKLRRSYTAGAVPLTSDLETNECCINYADNKLYVKTPSGTIQAITLGGGGGGGLTWSAVPESASATGTAGQIAYDNATGFFYVATATNTWKRTPLSTWTFDPKTIAGLQLWLDGDDATTLFDETTGGALVAAGGAVARWEDKSGSNRHATQETFGRRPNRQDNVQATRRVLRFDGAYNATTSERMIIPNSTSLFNFLHSGTGTVFAVASYTIARSFQTMLNNSQTNSGAGYILATATDSTYSWNAVARSFAGSGAAQVYDAVSTNGVLPTGAFKVITNKIDATNATAASRSRLYINGALNSGVNTSTGTASGNSFTNMIIGASENGGYSWVGDIAEILIYNSALSDTDRAAVESYLISKWGVS